MSETNRIPFGPADDAAERAALVRPTERQLAWHALERTAFLHFGINTFTDEEWGYGTEDPDLFQPAGLDAGQWARELAAAGFGLAVLTVKHHDGFVLYPSALTAHSVAASSWRGGRGDVLRDFVTAMRAHGLKVGVYLSPADEHEPSYANGSARRPREIGGLTLPASDYGAYMLGQLHEVLTGYGPIDEIWFDGARGRLPDDRVEDYDFDSWYALIRHLSPDTVIAVTGPDVRWVGNEDGLAREDEWNVVPVALTRGRADVLPAPEAPDLGSRESLAALGGGLLQWWPAEVDVSIRPGWFHHERERPKSVEELMAIYHASVGRGAVLLLNVPPDRRGLLPEADVAVLRAWRARIDRDYGVPLPAVRADPPGGGGTEVVLTLPAPARVERIVLTEEIRYGQRVEAVSVESDGVPIASCGTVGAKRILLLPAPVSLSEVRIRVLRSRGQARLGPVTLYGGALT